MDSERSRRRSSPPHGFAEACTDVFADPADGRAWRQLQNAADPSLRRIIARIFGRGRESDIDDALALTWERLLFRVTRARSEPLPDAPWSYLRAIARNTAIDVNRKRDVRPPSDDVVISATDSRSTSAAAVSAPSQSTDPLEALIAADLAAYLEEKLRPREWAVIADIAAGYSSSEVAERLTLSEANIRQIKKRALLHAAALMAAQNLPR